MLILLSVINKLPHLPFFCILSKQMGYFLLGVQQQTERWFLLQDFH